MTAPPKIVRVPGSKSLTQRALVIAALARDNSFISNPLISEDTNYLMEGLRILGAQIVSVSGGLYVNGTAGKLANTNRQIFLGNNGTALRFLTALVCLGQGQYILTGEKRLRERPVGALAEALKKMGAHITCTSDCPPVTINANGLAGGKKYPSGTWKALNMFPLFFSARLTPGRASNLPCAGACLRYLTST